MKKIEGLIFDYGGTLDSNGQHWAGVLWSSYQKYEAGISREQFDQAYVFAERKMATHAIITEDFNFLQVLKAKLSVQFEYLASQDIRLDNQLADLIANDGYELAKNNVLRVTESLNRLHEKYPVVMVSNFYGNLTSVLRDFGIYNCFDKIIESSVVGVRKPDPAIYALGVDVIGLPAADCLVIGDSYSKDMVPAKACGCQTLWLKGEGWKGDDEGETKDADYTFYDIGDLERIIMNWESL